MAPDCIACEGPLHTVSRLLRGSLGLCVRIVVEHRAQRKSRLYNGIKLTTLLAQHTASVSSMCRLRRASRCLARTRAWSLIIASRQLSRRHHSSTHSVTHTSPHKRRSLSQASPDALLVPSLPYPAHNSQRRISLTHTQHTPRVHAHNLLVVALFPCLPFAYAPFRHPFVAAAPSGVQRRSRGRA